MQGYDGAVVSDGVRHLGFQRRIPLAKFGATLGHLLQLERRCGHKLHIYQFDEEIEQICSSSQQFTNSDPGRYYF